MVHFHLSTLICLISSTFVVGIIIKPKPPGRGLGPPALYFRDQNGTLVSHYTGKPVPHALNEARDDAFPYNVSPFEGTHV